MDANEVFSNKVQDKAEKRYLRKKNREEREKNAATRRKAKQTLQSIPKRIVESRDRSPGKEWIKILIVDYQYDHDQKLQIVKYLEDKGFVVRLIFDIRDNYEYIHIRDLAH